CLKICCILASLNQIDNLPIMPNFLQIKALLGTTMELTIVLIVTATVFVFFILLAIIKMYRLKAENKKLMETNAFKHELDESYKDFTGGHLYGDN
ncbi:MAG: hypothetical protein AAF901_05355, partial [Bacteroidota bacterium]